MSDKIVYAAIVFGVLVLVFAFATNSDIEFWTDFARAIGKALLIVSIPLAIAAIFFLPRRRK